MAGKPKNQSRPLLARKDFSDAVAARDGHACVICGRSEGNGIQLDAHHILERRLWPDGGYYVDNGATVCDEGVRGCHYKCETTEISVEDLRRACGIDRPVLPPDMYSDVIYDKWGNTILPNGQRTKGPFYFDESVNRILKPLEPLFTDYVKYPRTWHLPWSPGATEDDRMLADVSAFERKRVVVTRKMDGENFSGYGDSYTHARSIDGRAHPSQDWAKSFWAQRAHDLPKGWRVVAENLFAVHSLTYEDLPGYLMGISIWTDRNICLSWDETCEWFALLDMIQVPVLYDGIFDEALIRELHIPKRDDGIHEGYVVRVADAFSYGAFPVSIGKYVRANHVTSDRHWKHGRIPERNRMRRV